MAHLHRKHLQIRAGLVILAFGLFFIPLAIFASIADEVRERAPLPFDVPILSFLHSLHTPLLNNIFLFITSCGQPLVIAGLGVVGLILLIVKRYYREAAMLAAGLGGSVLADQLLKVIFARARPDQFVPVLREASYSFPSGHAMASAALATTIIIIFWRTKYRVPVIIVGVIASFLIGLSRLYLGVHYPSDVLAGWSAGIVWASVAGSVILDRPVKLGRRLTPGTLES